jgi:hypothetical protein
MFVSVHVRVPDDRYMVRSDLLRYLSVRAFVSEAAPAKEEAKVEAAPVVVEEVKPVVEETKPEPVVEEKVEVVAEPVKEEAKAPVKKAPVKKAVAAKKAPSQAEAAPAGPPKPSSWANRLFPGGAAPQQAQAAEEPTPAAAATQGEEVVVKKTARKAAVPDCSLYVSSLPTPCLKEDIISVFQKVGEVKHVELPLKKSYCFVTFVDPANVDKAIQGGSYTLGGATLSVDKKRSYSERSGRDDGERGRGSGRGRGRGGRGRGRGAGRDSKDGQGRGRGRGRGEGRGRGRGEGR